jgi:hypothetical protein
MNNCPENCANCAFEETEVYEEDFVDDEIDEEAELERLLNDLTPEQEAKLQDYHAKSYMGTDDDMPDDFEKFLCGLTFLEAKKIIE